MRRDSVSQTLLVATVLCVVCSVLVASAAVGLRSIQEYNKELDRRKNVLIAAGLFKKGQGKAEQVDEIFKENIKQQLIDLQTGAVASASDVNPETYEQREAVRDPEQSTPIDPPSKLSGIKRRKKYAFVYQVTGESREVEKVVLPVYGKGLWSTLYGFIAVDPKSDRVEGITFYEHGETPGLGGEIENPGWQQMWKGKYLYDDEGKVAFEVIKGTVDPESPAAKHQVDGLSGATITSNGVTQMVHYWMGPDGFGPYLEKLRQRAGGGSHG